MKLNILLLFMGITVSSVFAQNLSYDVSPVIVENVVPQLFEGVGHSLITNTADETRDFRWTMNVVEMTDTWAVAFCDKNLCHDVIITTEEFFLEPGEAGRMDVHAYPNQTVGSAIIEIVTNDIADPAQELSNLYYFNAGPTNTQELVSQAIKVYPNPSNGLFSVKGDKGIAQVEVFSLAGTKVKSFTYGDGQWYDISDLPRGTYMVRLVDRDAQQVVTKLMNKL